MRNMAVQDWKSRLALLPLPIDPAHTTSTRAAYRLLAGRDTADAPVEGVNADLTERINTILIGPGFPPSQEFPAHGNVCPPSNAKLTQSFMRIALNNGTSFLEDSDIWNTLPVRAQAFLRENILMNPDLEDEEVPFHFLKIPSVASWSVEGSRSPFVIREDTVLAIRVYSPGNMAAHNPHLLQVHRSLCEETDSPNHTNPGIMYWYLEQIILPHYRAGVLGAILILYPVTHHNDNAFPIIPHGNNPPHVPEEAQFPAARIVRDHGRFVARIDESMERIGRYIFDRDNPDVFVALNRRHGYPPHQG